MGEDMLEIVGAATMIGLWSMAAVGMAASFKND